MSSDFPTIDTTTTAPSDGPARTDANPLPAIGQRCAETVKTMPRPLRLVSAGAMMCAFGSLMPWGYLHSGGGVASTQRSSSATLALVMLSAGVVWAALPAMSGAIARRRLAVLAALVGLTGVLAIGGWAMVSQLAKSNPDPTAAIDSMLGIHEHVTASAGFGLLLWTAGAVAMAIGTLWVWGTQRRAVAMR